MQSQFIYIGTGSSRSRADNQRLAKIHAAKVSRLRRARQIVATSGQTHFRHFDGSSSSTTNVSETLKQTNEELLPWRSTTAHDLETVGCYFGEDTRLLRGMSTSELHPCDPEGISNGLLHFCESKSFAYADMLADEHVQI
jgi:hypothetical protein